MYTKQTLWYAGKPYQIPDHVDPDPEIYGWEGHPLYIDNKANQEEKETSDTSHNTGKQHVNVPEEF
jgi:hypothetical protein